MRARLLAFVSAVSLGLAAMVVTAPSADAAGFPGWSKTKLSLTDFNSALSSAGLQFGYWGNPAGERGRNRLPGTPGNVGNNYSHFLNKNKQLLVFRVRKGFGGSLPVLSLFLRDATSGKRVKVNLTLGNPYPTDQTNTVGTGITRISFTAGGKNFVFSPT